MYVYKYIFIGHGHSLYAKAWPTVCTQRHGPQCVCKGMAHSVYAKAWPTVCTQRHGPQCVRKVMAHSFPQCVYTYINIFI